jgi:2'-5' RNA ligase
VARLFTAVELSAAVRDALAAQQALIAARLGAAGERSLRPVAVSQLHLTIVFIGEVPEHRVDAVVEAMSADLTVDQFDVEFEGWGVFPPRGAPRLLWCGIGRGREGLIPLHGHVTALLQRAGIATEDRPYSPHLTVGRWRDRADVNIRRLLPEPSRFATQPVQAVTLFRSRLQHGGAEHTALAHARLAGTAGPH